MRDGLLLLILLRNVNPESGTWMSICQLWVYLYQHWDPSPAPCFTSRNTQDFQRIPYGIEGVYLLVLSCINFTGAFCYLSNANSSWCRDTGADSAGEAGASSGGVTSC